YASLENESDRHLTLQGQQFVPGDRQRVLLPLVCCRECGHEYYCVRQVEDGPSQRVFYTARELSDRLSNAGTIAGYLYFSSENPWPGDRLDELLDRLPDDWVEEHRGQQRVKPSRQRDVPEAVRLAPD